MSRSNALFGHSLSRNSLSKPVLGPSAPQGDGSFAHEKFRDYFDGHDIELLPVPPRCHLKNVLESKHGVIRAIYLRLTSADTNLATQLALQQVVFISNKLYAFHLFSASRLANGFSMTHVTATCALPADKFAA